VNEVFLTRKLQERIDQKAYRQLRLPDDKTDFCSNDYLGIVRNGLIENASGDSRPEAIRHGGLFRQGDNLRQGDSLRHGSTGSRLLAGNYALIEDTERSLAAFHKSPAGLIFNSGYDANLGLLSCVPQRGDTVLYDYLSHASIRDGIRLSFARSYAFGHNDLNDLEKKLQAAAEIVAGDETVTGDAAIPAKETVAGKGTVFVVTESVFSMDGDQAPLMALAALCKRYGANLIVDEAHATGVVGMAGAGLVQELGLEESCFARIHTFGKAVGCHGAIILGSVALRNYLINFCRAFIYTTALPEASINAIRTAYVLFPGMDKERDHLRQLIARFRQASMAFDRLNSQTPIQVVIVPGNEAVKELAGRLQDKGLDVRPILYPTVPKGSERLRIVLHAFNTVEQTDMLIRMLQ
jgi:8-amino-7-oxononanoate synthase